MKDLSIIDFVGSKSGMDSYSTALLKEMYGLDYKVTLYSNFTDRNNLPFKVFKVFKEKTPNYTFFKILDFCLGVMAASLRMKMRKENNLLIHIFSYSFKEVFILKICRLLNIEICCIIHDIESFDNTSSDNRLQNIFDGSKFVIVHNQFSKNELLKNLMRSNEAKIIVMPHGNYLDVVTNNGIKPSSLPDFKKPFVLFFGQIKGVKGLDILLKALNSINSQLDVVIAGKPWKDDFNQYIELIQSLHIKDRVHLIPRFINEEERDYLFTECHSVVIPYKKIYQSGVLLMAMSYGKPVIASNLDANKEIIMDKKNGVLFETENPMDLAIKLNLLVNDIELRDNIISETKKYIVKEHSWLTSAKMLSAQLEIVSRQKIDLN